MAALSNFDDLFRLDGKVALVTGGMLHPESHSPSHMRLVIATSCRESNGLYEHLAGSRGLGLHTATGFLLSGASLVIITARNASGSEGLDMAVEKLKVLSSGSEKVKGRVIAIPADLSTYSEIVRLKDTLANQHSINHIDILVANAAATWGGPFETTPDWSSGKILDLNVRSVFGLVQVFQSMLEKAATERDPSRVIIVSSTAGRTVPHVKENGKLFPRSILEIVEHELKMLTRMCRNNHVRGLKGSRNPFGQESCH